MTIKLLLPTLSGHYKNFKFVKLKTFSKAYSGYIYVECRQARNTEKIMIVLEVKLNGEVITIAGKSDLCVLNTIVDGVGVLGEESIGTKSEKDGYQTSLHVGGLGVTSDDEPGTHYNWLRLKPIELGDEVTLKFIESDYAHNPTVEIAYTSEEKENEMKLRWETSRDYYLKYKDKYE